MNRCRRDQCGCVKSHKLATGIFAEGVVLLVLFSRGTEGRLGHFKLGRTRAKLETTPPGLIWLEKNRGAEKKKTFFRFRGGFFFGGALFFLLRRALLLVGKELPLLLRLGVLFRVAAQVNR